MCPIQGLFDGTHGSASGLGGAAGRGGWGGWDCTQAIETHANSCHLYIYIYTGKEIYSNGAHCLDTGVGNFQRKVPVWSPEVYTHNPHPSTQSVAAHAEPIPLLLPRRTKQPSTQSCAPVSRALARLNARALSQIRLRTRNGDCACVLPVPFFFETCDRP